MLDAGAFLQYIVANEGRTLLLVGGLIFNAGGFVWLAKNHFHTVNTKLDRMEKNIDTLATHMAEMDRRLSKMEGFCLSEHHKSEV